MTDHGREGHRSAPSYSFGATYMDACEEALRRGDRKVGSEHLLLALLRDSTCRDSLGVDLDAARRALQAMDEDDLAAIGVDARQCDAPPLAVHRSRFGAKLPLTPSAKGALSETVKTVGRRGLSPRHLLRQLLARSDADVVSGLVARLGVDRLAVIARLQEV